MNRIAGTHPALIEARVLEALRRNTARELERARVPGLQFALQVGTRPARCYAAGAARADSGEPVTQATRFRVASLGKPLAALVMLRAAAAGVIDLETPVVHELAWVPGLRGHAELKELTLRHLLTHSGGIADEHVPHFQTAGLESERLPTLREVLAGPRVNPRFERRVGQKSVYSGMNYGLAEAVVCERLSGGFEGLARRFVPELEYGVAARTAAGVAWEHDAEGRVLPHQAPVALMSSGLVASAGVICGALHRALLCAAGVRSEPDLPQDWALQLVTLHPTQERPKFTVGLHKMRSTTLEVFDHGGHRPGLRCSLNVIPSANVTAVALTNGERGQEVIEPVLAMVRAICGCREEMKQGGT